MKVLPSRAASPTPTPPTDRPSAPTRRRVVVALAALAYVAFVALRLLAHGGDPAAFIDAGSTFTRESQAQGIDVHRGDGYDGQYFYRLALDPLTDGLREDGVRFDRPAYRHQRIAYPALAWLASGGGQEGAVPWALIGVNLAGVVALAALAVTAATDAGRSPWIGLLVAGWPGIMVALARDLSEVLAATFLLATLLALRRQRWVTATTLLLLAALTRETTLVLAAALLGSMALGRLPWRGWWDSFADRDRTVPWYVPIVPLVVLAGWHEALAHRWAGVPITGVEPPSFVGVPFLAFARQLGRYATSGDVVDLYQLVQVLLLVFVVGTLVATLRHREAGRPHERLALVGFAAVMTMLPAWDRSVVFLRWADEAVILGTLCALSLPRFRFDRVARATGALWLTTALVWVGIT